MSAIAGIRGNGDWGTDERPKNFREMILFRNPNGTAPIFGLTSKLDEESVDDPEFSWWDEPNDLVRLQLNGAIANGGVTTFVVDSSDPDATVAGRERHWGLAKHLKAGDLLMVEKTTEIAAIDNEIVEVVSVTNDTTFVVARGVCGTAAGAIADDIYLLKIGSRYGEGSNAASATTRNPVKYSNYCQIWKTSYEIARTVLKTKIRTGDPLKNDKKRKVFDHSRDIEMSILFGRKNETTDSNGKPVRTMGGLREFIPTSRTTIFGAAITTSTLLDALYPMFDYDTPSGDTRLAFCGNGALNAINKLVAASSDINFTGVVETYGMKLREYVLPQGRLLLKTHPLLNRHSLYTKSIIGLDQAALRWRELRSTFFEDDIQTPGSDSKKGQWITESGMEVRFGGLTCCYLGNVYYP